MNKIKYLLEYYSPRNYRYFSLWDNEDRVQDVIITDVNSYCEKKDCLKIQLEYPFNKNNAILVIEKIKTYFKSNL